MGMLLCIPLMIAGLALIAFALSRRPLAAAAKESIEHG